MPTIEGYRQQSGLLEKNPDTNIPVSGGIWDAIGNLGKTINSVSQDLAEQFKRAEVADAVLKRGIEDAEYVAKAKEDLRKEYMITHEDGSVEFDPRGKAKTGPDGNAIYPDSYSNKMKKIVNDRYEEGMKMMPYDDAKILYQRDASRLIESTILTSTNEELLGKANLLSSSKQRHVNNTIDVVYRDGSLITLKESLKKLGEYYEKAGPAIAQNGDVQADYQNSSNSIINNGFLRHYLERNPAAGLAILGFDAKGKPVKNPSDETKFVNNFLTKDQIPDWVDKFQTALKEKQTANSHLAEGRLNDLQSASLGGRFNGSWSDFQTLHSQIQYKTPEDKIRAMSNSATAFVVGNNLKTLGGKSNAEVVNYMSTEGSSALGKEIDSIVMAEAKRVGFKLPQNFNDKNSIGDRIKVVNARVADLLQERNNDPASSLSQTDNTLKELNIQASGGFSPSTERNEEYFSLMLNKQKDIGTPIKLIPPSQAKSLAEQIKNPNPQIGAAVIDELKRKHGKFFDANFDQIIKDGNLPDYFHTVSMIDDEGSMMSIMNAFNQGKDAEEILKGMGKGSDVKSINSAVLSELAEYAPIINNMDNGIKKFNGLREAAVYLAGMNTTAGINMNMDFSSKTSAPAKQAVNSVIRNKYAVHEGALIPRDQEIRIKTEMGSITSPLNINKNIIQNVFIPNETNTGPIDVKRIYNTYLTQGKQPQIGVEGIDYDRTKGIYQALQDSNKRRWELLPDGLGASLKVRIVVKGIEENIPIMVKKEVNGKSLYEPLVVRWNPITEKKK